MAGNQPTRLTARVAPFRDAIAAARAAGYTWVDLARVLDVANATSLRRAWAQCGKYQAEQAPLPQQAVTTAATESQKHNSSIKRISL